MNILIDILHPAHVHFFKNFIKIAQKKNHEIFVTSREKEMTNYLLDIYEIDHVSISSIANSTLGLGKELLYRNLRFLHVAKKFKPDILLGIMGPTIAPMGKLIGVPSLVFYDTEHARITNSWVYPLATTIITPSCYKENLGKKHVTYNGYHELAYLHPNYFKPDISILNELGLGNKEKFAIIRFVSWGAGHDIGKHGIDLEKKKRIIKHLSKSLKVFISSENKLPHDLEQFKLSIPYEKIHDVLYFAYLYFGEGGTMASEAAMLGTPAIYVNCLKLGYIQELETVYDMIYSHDSSEEGFDRVLKLLELDIDLKKEWMLKKKKLLKDKTDVTKFLIDLVTQYDR